MRETFYLDGVNCEDYGIRLQRPLSFSSAMAKVDTISIPGRNGDLHISDGSYKNIEGIADCFSLQENVCDAVESAANWLMSGNGYRRLEVSDDPHAFRMARITASPERDFRMRCLAPFSVVFDCDPRRFLLEGEQAIELIAPGSIENYTAQIALPLITVYGDAPGNLTINGVIVEIKELTDEITLDSETQNAYRNPGEGGIENKNYAVNAPLFPALNPGANAITWTGGIKKIEIIPRWWTL